jgi:hypothetical protein
MDSNSRRGQILVELIIATAFLLAFTVLAFHMTQATTRELGSNSKWRSRDLPRLQK